MTVHSIVTDSLGRVHGPTMTTIGRQRSVQSRCPTRDPRPGSSICDRSINETDWSPFELLGGSDTGNERASEDTVASVG